MGQQLESEISEKPRKHVYPKKRTKDIFKEVVIEGKPIGPTMVKHGFAQSTADTPSNLTDTLAWKQLLAQELSDPTLLTKHKQLLGHKRLDYFVFPKNMADEEIEEKVNAVGIKVINIRPSEKGKMAFYATDDATAQGKSLELAYKLKNKFPAQEHKVEGRLLIGHLLKFVEHGTIPRTEAGEIGTDSLLKGVEDVESV